MLTLAYATTIHKAQGSEDPIVVMPIAMSHFRMLQRNLLYIGVAAHFRQNNVPPDTDFTIGSPGLIYVYDINGSVW